MAVTGKERLAAFRRAVAGISDAKFQLELSHGLADVARGLIFGDLGRKLGKKSGKLTGATSVGGVTTKGFKMGAKVPYAGTLNWGSNRIVRIRYARFVAPGIVRFIPFAKSGMVLTTGAKMIGAKAPKKVLGGPTKLKMPTAPGVVMLTIHQTYPRRQFIPGKKIPVRWLKAFEPVVKTKVAEQIGQGWR